MKNFYLVSGDVKETMVESEVVRTGYLLSGAIGLIESIEAYRQAGFSIIVDETTSDPYILTESSALMEGWFDSAKEKIGQALKSVKDGKMSKDAFDEFYQQMKSEGKLSGNADFGSAVRNMTRNTSNPLAGLGSRTGSVPTSGREKVSIRPDSSFNKTAVDTTPKNVLNKEELAKKVSDYKKVFALDVAKYKKLFSMAPSAVEEFKSVLDEMIGARDKKFADLAKMEAVEGETTDTAPKTDEKPKAEPAPVAPKTEAAPKATKFGVRWGEGRMVVFSGSPEMGATVKIVKVEGTNNLKVGEEAKITKVVENGKPMYMEMASGDNKGRTFNTTALTALKTA